MPQSDFKAVAVFGDVVRTIDDLMRNGDGTSPNGAVKLGTDSLAEAQHTMPLVVVTINYSLVDPVQAKRFPRQFEPFAYRLAAGVLKSITTLGNRDLEAGIETIITTLKFSNAYVVTLTPTDPRLVTLGDLGKRDKTLAQLQQAFNDAEKGARIPTEISIGRPYEVAIPGQANPATGQVTYKLSGQAFERVKQDFTRARMPR